MKPPIFNKNVTSNWAQYTFESIFPSIIDLCLVLLFFQGFILNLFSFVEFVYDGKRAEQHVTNEWILTILANDVLENLKRKTKQKHVDLKNTYLVGERKDVLTLNCIFIIASSEKGNPSI